MNTTTTPYPEEEGLHIPSNNKKKNQDEEKSTSVPNEMSLFDHLGELRSCLIKAVSSIIAIFFLAFAFASPIIELLKKPLLESVPILKDKIYFTGPLDVFVVNIKVSFIAAIVLGSPIWLYQFWRFIEPALYPKERKLVLPFILASIALFLLGVSFCYSFVLPVILKYLVGLGMEVGTPLITIKDYFSLLLLLILAFGFIFETPLILILLASLELISADTLANNRKFIIVGVLVVGALLTPPDPISQLALAIPTYLMFEASIAIIRLIQRSKV